MRPLLATAAALFLSGCEVYAVPSPLPCPGDSVGTFEFSGVQVLGPADCFFAQPANAGAYQVVNPIAFPGTVNFGPGASDAAVCITQPHAVPRLGTHAGVSIDVAYENRTASVGACTCQTQEAATAGKCLCPPNSGIPLTGCSCPVIVEERIQGNLVPIPGGFSGFTGTQLVTVTPPPLALPAQPCDCQLACTYSYALAATAVGSR